LGTTNQPREELKKEEFKKQEVEFLLDLCVKRHFIFLGSVGRQHEASAG
jgi:hypothetical protein